MQNMAETRVTSLATDLGFPKTDVLWSWKIKKSMSTKRSSQSIHLYLMPCLTVNSRKAQQLR